MTPSPTANAQDEAEAERIVEQHCEEWRWGPFDGFSGTAEWGLAVRATACGIAFARQQIAEASISDAQINDAIRHGFGHRFADADQCDRVVAALENLRVNPSIEEIPLVLSEILAILQPDVLRDRIAVLERENRNYAKTMDIIGSLPQ